jgi:hypothetical protein
MGYKDLRNDTIFTKKVNSVLPGAAVDAVLTARSHG